jgi:benzodiazapine receptor
MGISAGLVWQKGLERREVRVALIIFGIQLALNFLWSVIFFGLKLPWLAFGEILILWVAIALTIAKFYSISKPAAYLLILYILWVSFASILNFSVAFLN